MSDQPLPHSRKNPFHAPLKATRLLTPGSDKETRHFEFLLDGSTLTYEVGDSLGVFPANNPQRVERVLDLLGLDGTATCQSSGAMLRDALARHHSLREVGRQLLAAAVAADSLAAPLAPLLEPEQRPQLEAWLAAREVVDVFEEFPGLRPSAEVLPSLLRKLQPRLYSIASSPRACPGEVHLTVAVVRYQQDGKPREGVCSAHLADRVAPGSTVPVFVHPAKHFRLPEDPEAPVIMVGPGTGVAPFRAFLQDRLATGARGRNWLFFGDRRRAHDFLYAEELEAWHRRGHLHRLDTAFSRDQAGKIYVQHRMLERAAELWAWLQEGGYFYVCGDASRMAKDVETALHRVAETAGGLSPEAAAAWVQELKQAKRYRKDVY